MKNIEDLVKIVTANSLQPNIKKAALKGRPTKMSELFSEYASRPKAQVITERARMKAPAYRKLKSRLSDHLIRTILFSDSNRLLKSNYDKQYIKGLRNLILSNILYLNYSKKAANEILEKNVRNSEFYHFTELSLASLRLLKYHSAFLGHQKRYIKYNKQIGSYLNSLSAEIKIEGYSQDIILELHHTSTIKIERSKEFERIYREIISLVKRYPTRTNMLNSFRYGIHLMEYLQKHNTVIILCKKAENYLLKNGHLSQKMRQAEFALYKLNSCLRMQNIVEGRKCADQCDRIFNKGTDNWYIYQEYYFLLCMHTRNYHKAQDAMSQVKDDSRFLRINASRNEKWHIYEAFLSFVLPLESTRRFNLYRFLNEVPLHSSDKSGFNLSILIAQIITLVNLGKFDEILEKSDALNIYCRRYIRIKDKYRTYYFMKMLQVMIKYSFDSKKTEQIAQKFVEALAQPARGKRPLEEMEVIPYETLWSLILEKLKGWERKIL